MNERGKLTVVAAFILILVLSMVGFSSGSSRQPVTLESGPRVGMVTAADAVISWDTYSATQGIAVNYRVSGERKFTGKVISSKNTTRHSVTITNLKPGTMYEYQVEGHPETGTFRTSSPDTTKFVFVSMADNRGQSDAEDIKGLPRPFIDIIKDAATRNPVFAVNAGDLFYGKNSDRDTFKQLYTTFKKAIHPLAIKTPYYITPGNHEMSPFIHNNDTPGFDPVALFNEEFQQPGPLKGYEGSVFSWDYGKAHFVSIATNYFDMSMTVKPKHAMYYISDAQIAWLDNDLKNARNSGAQFIIVFGHSNAFLGTGGKWADLSSYVGDLNNVDPQQRDKFWAVLATYKTDAYVCGHRHFSDDSIVKDGVVQWMNGDSGSVVGGPNNYTVWTVDGNTMTAQLVDDKGKNARMSRTFTKKYFADFFEIERMGIAHFCPWANKYKKEKRT